MNQFLSKPDWYIGLSGHLDFTLNERHVPGAPPFMRGLRALLGKNYLLILLWLLWWPVNLGSLIAAFTGNGMLLNAIARLAVLALLTFFLWRELLSPGHELLIRRALIERTVHINWAKHLQMRGGLGATSVKTSEIREGLRYHEPIPEDMIVDKKLTIGYLPKSLIILYVKRPEA